MEGKLIECPICGNTEDCYESAMGDFSTYLCYKCGYTGNSSLTANSPRAEEMESHMPDFIRDMKIYDRDRDINWYLAMVQTDLGMVIPESREDGWGWLVALMTEIPEEDRVNYPIPDKDNEFYKYRIDLQNAQRFNRTEFKQALVMILSDDSQLINEQETSQTQETD